MGQLPQIREALLQQPVDIYFLKLYRIVLCGMVKISVDQVCAVFGAAHMDIIGLHS